METKTITLGVVKINRIAQSEKPESDGKYSYSYTVEIECDDGTLSESGDQNDIGSAFTEALLTHLTDKEFDAN